MVVHWADEPKEDQTADGGETLFFKAIFCKKKKTFCRRWRSKYTGFWLRCAYVTLMGVSVHEIVILFDEDFRLFLVCLFGFGTILFYCNLMQIFHALTFILKNSNLFKQLRRRFLKIIILINFPHLFRRK